MTYDYIPFFRLTEDAISPTRNNITDAGMDLYAAQDVFIPYQETKVVPTGIAIKVPEGFVGKIFDRSSMGKNGLAVGAGVIDAGYSGEVCILVHNLTHHHDHDFTYTSGYKIKRGDKVAQLVLMPVITPEPVEIFELWNSERGNRGFGSSGR